SGSQSSQIMISPLLAGVGSAVCVGVGAAMGVITAGVTVGVFETSESDWHADSPIKVMLSTTQMLIHLWIG
ncbi:MAG: hypothetical protein KAR65_04985, partial [Anaerolineales bacterium]|nr:hypothetical protein [Anaerolineales bacterium]